MLELSLERRVMITAKGYWVPKIVQPPFWECSMDDLFWFSQISEVCVNIISIITDERKGQLNQAEKGTLGKAFWTVVLIWWSWDMKEQQVTGTGRSAVWLEQKGCAGKWDEAGQTDNCCHLEGLLDPQMNRLQPSSGCPLPTVLLGSRSHWTLLHWNTCSSVVKTHSEVLGN